MSFTFKDLFKVRSKDDLAKRIGARWRKLEPRERIPKPRAIANRLGDLERDRPDWWNRRPAAKTALEQELGVGFEQLPVARDRFEFADFPKLRPFDPHAEKPLDLARTDWFGVPQKGERRWIVAPAGSGRSFTVHWHRVRQTAVAQEVGTLADAAGLTDPAHPIVLCVDVENPEDDPATLARMESRDRVMVIAPFPLPPVSPSDPLGQAVRRHTWSEQRWAPVPDWAERFVWWVAERIDEADSLFDPDAFLEWLHDVDPEGRLFPTPGDLLPMCALAHEQGERVFRRLGVEGVAERYVQLCVKREAADGSDRSIWLQSWGLQAIRALVTARLRDTGLRWRGGLTRAVWERLVPPEIAPRAPAADDVEKALADVASARGRKQKAERKREAKAKLLRRSPRETLVCLEPLRVLRSRHRDALTIHPRWVAEGFARGHVRRAFDESPATLWGRWAADGARRRLVDAELNDLGMQSLTALVRKAVAAFDVDDLGSVGAVEALFAAVGRRLQPARRPAAAGMRQTLLSLAEIQRDLMSVRYRGGAPAPLTRPGQDAEGAEQGEWVANCWAWSLSLPTPPRPAPDEHAWLFPGWCQVSLAKLLRFQNAGLGEPSVDDAGEGSGIIRGFPRTFWRDYLRSGDFGEPAPPPTNFGRILAMAQKVIAHCEDRDIPSEDLPAALVPAAILAAPERKWRMRLEQFDRFTGTSWGGPHLASACSALPPEQREAVVRWIWRTVLEASQGVLDAFDKLSRSIHLYVLVEEELSEGDFQSVLTEGDATAFSRIQDVPSRFRAPLVAWFLEHDPKALKSLLARVWDAQPDDAEWLELVAGHERGGWLAQRALWRVAPDEALERTRDGATEDESTAYWFHEAPPRFYPQLTELLEEFHCPLPDWARRWLLRRMLDSGALADRAYRLLRASTKAEVSAAPA